MTESDASSSAAPAPSSRRGGRPRDPSRDRAIIDATIDVLAEVGYEGLTMDAVASRAGAGKATLYRRWPSKGALVVDAVASVGDGVDPHDLPDTGSLRGDFAAVYVETPEAEGERLMRAMGGLVSVLALDSSLTEAVNAAVVDPFVETNRVIIRRAVARGEIPETTDVETIAHVAPLMTAFRLIVLRQPLDLAEIFRLLDVVVLPALHAGATAED